MKLLRAGNRCSPKTILKSDNNLLCSKMTSLRPETFQKEIFLSNNNNLTSSEVGFTLLKCKLLVEVN